MAKYAGIKNCGECLRIKVLMCFYDSIKSLSIVRGEYWFEVSTAILQRIKQIIRIRVQVFDEKQKFATAQAALGIGAAVCKNTDTTVKEGC